MGHLPPRQRGHRLHPGRVRAQPLQVARVAPGGRRYPDPQRTGGRRRTEVPALLGDRGGLVVQRAGFGEAAPTQASATRPRSRCKPGQQPTQHGDDRLDGHQLGLGVGHPARLQQRVETPEPAPQNGLRVAGALAEREHATAEHEPLGVAVGVGVGELPCPQRDRQRSRVVEPFGHGQRGRARLGDGPRVPTEQPAVRDLGEEPRLQRAVPVAEAPQRLFAPAPHRVEPRPLADLGQTERRAGEARGVAGGPGQLGGLGERRDRARHVVREAPRAGQLQQHGQPLGRAQHRAARGERVGQQPGRLVVGEPAVRDLGRAAGPAGGGAPGRPRGARRGRGGRARRPRPGRRPRASARPRPRGAPAPARPRPGRRARSRGRGRG